jgi:SAM-dependent methyltransferase
MGKGGSKHHQKLAIPTLLKLLDFQSGERVLDIGAGQGVLASAVEKAGAHYTGVEISKRLIEYAKQHHGRGVNILQGDATRLSSVVSLEAEGYDAAVYLLSIQDMDPLEDVFEGLNWAVKPGGRVGILMTHPCFRIPRQSGWGWDEGRKLQFRRVDRYLTPLPIPLKPYPGQTGVSRSYHRPLQDYVNGLGAVGFLVERIEEVPTYKDARGPRAKAENLANEEIPLFLGLRARKVV